jgi:hypothetical protein
MAQKLLRRLRPDSDMRALVAIREGVFIFVCPRLHGLVDEDQIIPGEVRTWLDKAGVLQERPPPFNELCRVRPEEEALYSYDHMAAAHKRIHCPVMIEVSRLVKSLFRTSTWGFKQSSKIVSSFPKNRW